MANTGTWTKSKIVILGGIHTLTTEFRLDATPLTEVADFSYKRESRKPFTRAEVEKTAAYAVAARDAAMPTGAAFQPTADAFELKVNTIDTGVSS